MEDSARLSVGEMFALIGAEVGRGVEEKEKLFYQTIHALHLAGRCTGCGECQRACPVGIPILALRQQISRAVARLFDGYQSGLDPEVVPPLLGYEVEEKNIQEREWQ